MVIETPLIWGWDEMESDGYNYMATIEMVLHNLGVIDVDDL